jgi:hypothetical protein
MSYLEWLAQFFDLNHDGQEDRHDDYEKIGEPEDE